MIANRILGAFVIGLGASLLMDACNLFLKRAFGIPSLNDCLLGRWLLAPSGWIASPTLLPALLYGIVTVVFPFFVMQPALGLGMAASRTPSPFQARMKSLATHTVFGVGMYLCALPLKLSTFLTAAEKGLR